MKRYDEFDTFTLVEKCIFLLLDYRLYLTGPRFFVATWNNYKTAYNKCLDKIKAVTSMNVKGEGKEYEIKIRENKANVGARSVTHALITRNYSINGMEMRSGQIRIILICH